MRNKRLWRILWLRYKPIIILMTLFTVVALVLSMMMMAANHQAMDFSAYKRMIRKAPGAYSGYKSYLWQRQHIYYPPDANGIIPSTNDGIILSLIMAGLAVVVGLTMSNWDIRSTFVTFCDNAGFTRKEFARYQNVLLGGTLLALTVFYVAAHFVGYFLIVPAKAVGLTLTAALMLIIYNIVWIAALFALAQLIGTVLGRSLISALSGLVVLGVLLLGIIGINFPAKHNLYLSVTDPQIQYWYYLATGLAILLVVYVMYRWALQQVTIDRLSAMFTVKGARTVSFLIVAVGYWKFIYYSVVPEGHLEILALLVNLGVTVVAGIVWFGWQKVGKLTKLVN